MSGEPEVSDLLTVAQALKIIDAAPVPPPRAQVVALHEAEGRVLAEDVRADQDYPPFDRSLMDGYAVRSADTAGGAELEVVGEIAAGSASEMKVVRGQAVAIMTGAPLPQGADGVVPVEHVERVTPSPRYSGERAGERGERPASAGDARLQTPLAPLPNPLPASGEREQVRIRVLTAAAPGRFITRRGSDARAGEVVLKQGTRLGAAQLAALATVGRAKVSVFARPQVAVLSTGNEVVPYDQVPAGAQIRNSNSIMLAALLRRLGCDVTDLGTVRDERDAVRDALAAGMEGSDVLLVTGGMSMGAYDFVPPTLAELGVELLITKLKIKPGKPFVFGALNRVSGFGFRVSGEENASSSDPNPEPRTPNPGRFVFGLPGNPVSAFVCTVRLASRLIARMSGTEPAERWIQASLSEPLPANGPREFYQPVFCRDGVAHVLQWKGSADVFALASANGLLVRGENAPPLAAGAAVRVLEV